MLPSGPGTWSISCFAREVGLGGVGWGEEGGKKGGGGGTERGTEPEQETHTEKEKQRDGERRSEGRREGRGGWIEEEVNEGLVSIHLALISQTERVMVREETEGLLFLALTGDTV